MSSTTTLSPYASLASVPAIPYKAPNNESSNWLFHHWSRHNSIVVGPTLYIHGGELNIWNGSADPVTKAVTIPNQYTYGIDLSTSWNIADVELNGTLSTARYMNSEALWLDASGSAFYVYNGGVSMSSLATQTPSPNELWKFSPSGTTGSWEQIIPQTDSNFSSLVRIWDGFYASGNGLGFSLGGNEGLGTIVSVGHHSGLDIGPTPGLVMFNSSSSDDQWYNLSSISPTYPSGVAMSGAAHFVPNFGPEGLLFVVGGYVDKGGTLAQTDKVTMFDPVSQSWATQVTTGKQPSPLQYQCLVGAKGDNGTYEIFMYGGMSLDSNTTLAQAKVSVLSLPSFIWLTETPSVNPKSGRFFHSCNLVGQRQMMVIGGIVTNSTVYQDKLPNAQTIIAGEYEDSSLPDPNPQGISIFDLSSFRWTTNYNATAVPYVTPDIVKNEIQAKGSFPSRWSNPLVQSWFNATPVESKPSNNTTPVDSRGSNNGPVQHHTSAIIGGVVGGVVLLVSVILTSLCLRARHRRQQRIADEKHGAPDPKTTDRGLDFFKPELPNNGLTEIGPRTRASPVELPNIGLVELSPRMQASQVEFPSSDPVELRSPQQTHGPQEVPARDPGNPVYEIF